MKRKVVLLLLLLVASLALTSIAAAQDEEPAQASATTIMDVIESDERLTTFKTLVQAAVLANNLNEDGPFTVFAPTNEAFITFEAMNEESEIDMTEVLLYHVVNGSYESSSLTERTSLPTLMGERLYFKSDNNTLSINQIGIVSVADIQTSNGVIHIIDRVLLPTTAQRGNPGATIMEALAADGRFETLTTLLSNANLEGMLNDANQSFTLFAPTDEAFAAAPESLVEAWTADPEGELRTILTYHIVGDPLRSHQIANDDFIPTWEGRPLRVSYSQTEGLRLNGQTVATADMLTANGVIHAVNAVIIP